MSSTGPSEGLADCVQVREDRIITRMVDGGTEPGIPQSPRLLALITSLSALMLQVKRVADGERSGSWSSDISPDPPPGMLQSCRL